MQHSPSEATAGALVCLRRQRWRVLDAHVDGPLRLLTLAGAGASNGGLERRFITPFDIVSQIERAIGPTRRCSTRAWRRTLRHVIASSAPPGSLRALPRASIDLLAHQLSPALAIVRGLFTRVLLADDVGLGKTIEAGLILAELMARDAVRRALLLTPSGLREQWRDELDRRFALRATIVDAASLRATTTAFGASMNPWLACDVAIASIDFAKRPEHLAHVLACEWDLLIVDEAHNAVGDSERRVAVASIAARVPYVVLVTATPHNGNATSFSSLCGIGAHGEPIGFFRRTRSDVRLGVGRRVHRLLVTPTAAERRMHETLAEFTRAVTRERGESNRDVWLALAVMNKRALSSATALQRTAARRIASLKASLADARQSCTSAFTRGNDAPDPPDGWTPTSPGFQQLLPLGDPDGELDDSDDAPEWSGGPALADARGEIRMLEAIQRASAEAAFRSESKINALRRWIGRIDEPVIVFTEYRDTLQHLATTLGVPTLQLHGGLARDERAAVLDEFARPPRPRVLLATDAAGEGLNLHERCRVVVNLELPWNPVRIEQRIGRVDRIGQSRTVHALALIAERTPEERILKQLRVRGARATRAVGGADPLQLVTEADIERLVISGTQPREVVDQSPSLLPSPALSSEAHAEVERARLHRTFRQRPRDDPAADAALIAIARHAVTRRRLGGATIVVAEAVLEDAAGRVVERTVLPFQIPRSAVSEASMAAIVRSVDLLRALPGFDVWRAEAASLWHTFANARLERERAILGLLQRDERPLVIQPGLFEHRAERAAAAARAAHAFALEAAMRRIAMTELAASACTASISVRLVLKGNP